MYFLCLFNPNLKKVVIQCLYVAKNEQICENIVSDCGGFYPLVSAKII